MKKRILLVDDEEILLSSLKEGLESLGDLFLTDTCSSVDEAIELINKNDYSLIITDIRMPGKNGIDLLLYLNENNFTGTIKVMSAHEVENDIYKIKGLGAIEIISKPFRLSWFKEMLKNFFENENNSDILFESISLLSVLQIVNAERKSSVLHIENDGIKGLIYLKKGEVINASYGDLKEMEALSAMLKLKDIKISIKKSNKKIEKKIDIPFTELILNLIKTIDENKKKSTDSNKSNNRNYVDSLQLINRIYDIVENKKGLSGRMELSKITGISKKEAVSSGVPSPALIKKIRSAANKILGAEVDDFL